MFQNGTQHTRIYSLSNCKVVENLKLVFVLKKKKPCILEYIDARPAKTYYDTYFEKERKKEKKNYRTNIDLQCVTRKDMHDPIRYS